MASQARKHRGMATQRLVAEWFQERGWPFAYSKGSGESGIDIMNMPDLSPEVKAQPGDTTGALRQAVKNRGDGLPFVVWRPNGYGPERIEEWPVIFTLADATELLRQAGYGDTDDRDHD